MPVNSANTSTTFAAGSLNTSENLVVTDAGLAGDTYQLQVRATAQKVSGNNVTLSFGTTDNFVEVSPSGGVKGDAGAAGPAGSSTFIGQTDTPNSFTGEGGKHLAVNSGGTGVEFVDAPSGGGGSFQLRGPELARTITITHRSSASRLAPEYPYL